MEGRVGATRVGPLPPATARARLHTPKGGATTLRAGTPVTGGRLRRLLATSGVPPRVQERRLLGRPAWQIDDAATLTVRATVVRGSGDTPRVGLRHPAKARETKVVVSWKGGRPTPSMEAPAGRTTAVEQRVVASEVLTARGTGRPRAVARHARPALPAPSAGTDSCAARRHGRVEVASEVAGPGSSRARHADADRRADSVSRIGEGREGRRDAARLSFAGEPGMLGSPANYQHHRIKVSPRRSSASSLIARRPCLRLIPNGTRRVTTSLNVACRTGSHSSYHFGVWSNGTLKRPSHMPGWWTKSKVTTSDCINFGIQNQSWNRSSGHGSCLGLWSYQTHARTHCHTNWP